MRRLVILRPEPGASATADAARGMGLDPVRMPLFRIEPIAWDAPEASGFDGLLLTSANAVRQAGDKLQALRGLRVYAVGEATGNAARNADFDSAEMTVPTAWSFSAIWARGVCPLMLVGPCAVNPVVWSFGISR